MSGSAGFAASFAGLFKGALRQGPPPADYVFRSPARAALEQGSKGVDDKFGYADVTRSVNYQLDIRGVPLDTHSASKLLENVSRADSLVEVNDLHRAEMSHFLNGRNSRDNNYGSCVAGVIAHKAALTIWQIHHGDRNVPEPPLWL